MRIEVRPAGPLDVAATLERYRLWGEDPVNRLEDGCFRRALRLAGGAIPYELRWSGPVERVRIEARVTSGAGAGVRAALTREVRMLLGLDFDLPAFYGFAATQPALAELVAPLYGLRPTLMPVPFEMLITLISAQQVNLSFAFACRARLVRRYGEALPSPGGELYAFPQPLVLAEAEVPDLVGLKYSTRKAEYIRDLARAVVARRVDLAALAEAANDEVVRRLTELRGVGRWTAEWFLARHAGRGDVCPAGDLAVRKAFDRLFGRGRGLSEDAIRRRARRLGPHQNLAVHYMLSGMRRLRGAAARTGTKPRLGVEPARARVGARARDIRGRAG